MENETRSDREQAVEYRGILLAVNWKPGVGTSVAELPSTPGLYAEIHWPRRGVRVGETGTGIRRKIQHDIRWFKAMHEGRAPLEQLKRTIPIAQVAKELGAEAFEYYVVSVDPRLTEKSLRQDCERFVFRWLEAHSDYESWNHQKSWR